MTEATDETAIGPAAEHPAAEHPHDTPRWQHDGVRVVPAGQLDASTAQTPGMDRKAAINFARVGAQKLWAGTVHIHPDAKTGAPATAKPWR